MNNKRNQRYIVKSEEKKGATDMYIPQFNPLLSTVDYVQRFEMLNHLVPTTVVFEQ